MDWYPAFVLLVGVAVVIGLIMWLRINAFLALIAAAMLVSLMSPGEPAERIKRVAEAFGASAGSIGIVIAMAAVIGKCLMDSGAADRIVRSFIRLLGEERAPLALMGSGYVLAIPVFFDTVFYLLIPLARSLWRRRQAHYVLFTTAIVAGGAVTHCMVPPTPGPLAMADNLGVDLGLMILVGALIGIPMSLCVLVVCWWLDSWQAIPMRPYAGEAPPPELPDDQLPPLAVALLPVALPVLLIAANTAVVALAAGRPESWRLWLDVTGILGNPNFALAVSAALSIWLVIHYRQRSLLALADDLEQALMGGGLVILITAAGGAFGKMLASAGIQQTIQGLMGEPSSAAGMTVLLAAFGVASLMKFAQGSGTVAMITTSSMFAAMGFSSEQLGFHLVYLAAAIGSGSLVGDWMNNSGFWVFSKMSVFSTEETLKTWSILTASLGLAGILVTLAAALCLPLV